MKIRLAICYTTWTGDDMEMLKRSIEQHEKHVDKIIICWQEISNKGEKSTHNLPVIPFAHYVPFNPIRALNTKQNERNKHNLMIETAKHLGCTHFILAAGDHFYTDEQFEFAKEYHKNNDIDVSFTMMRTYYKQDNWYLEPMEYYYMPFIHKLGINTEITTRIKYPVLVDPSVKVNKCDSFRVFTPDECLLHHYSMIRPNIEKKLRNAAASIRWDEKQIQRFINEYNNAKPGDEITYFQGRKIVEISE